MNSARYIPRRCHLALALAGLALTVTGCAGVSQPKLTSSGVTCKEPPQTSDKTPTVAVLTQLGMTEPAASRDSQALAVVMRGATALKAHLLLNGIGSGATAPNLMINTSLVGQGPNDLFQSSDLACKTSAVTNGYDRLAAASDPRALDVFDALRTLQADLTGVPHGEIDVVLLGSLLNTANVDLTKPGVLSDPSAAINKLAELGLNFRCDGWRVYAVGGSLTSGGTITDAESSELERFYGKYFQHCGGALVVWDDSGLSTFPVSTGPIEGADYSTIQIVHRPHLVIATLSSDVLFPLGSSDLQPGAQTALRQLLPLVSHASGGTVDGYTDTTGNEAINGPLSLARAAAVANWLVRHAGLPSARFQVHGFGSADPVAPNGPAGQPLNRRVVITIRQG